MKRTNIPELVAATAMVCACYALTAAVFGVWLGLMWRVAIFVVG